LIAEITERPQMVVPTDPLLGRAEQLRRGVQVTVPGQPPAAPPGVRFNAPPRGVEVVPAPGNPPPVVTPPPVGGQPTYLLSEGGQRAAGAYRA
jgi:hypothetical protein